MNLRWQCVTFRDADLMFADVAAIDACVRRSSTWRVERIKGGAFIVVEEFFVFKIWHISDLS